MNRKELLLISVAIFLTVIAWLVADLYHAATTERLKDKVKVLKIKNYDMGKSIIDQLKAKD